VKVRSHSRLAQFLGTVCKVAPIPKSARSFVEVLTDLGLEVIWSARRMHRWVLHGRSRGLTDIWNKLANHVTCLTDLIKWTLKLYVPLFRVCFMLPYGKLGSSSTTDMLRVNTIFPNDGSSKWSINTDLSSSGWPKACCSTMTLVWMLHVPTHPALHWPHGTRIIIWSSSPALHWPHGTRIIIWSSRSLPKLPLTMGKMAFITELATLNCVVFIAQTGLHRWRRRAIWKRRGRGTLISRGWWKSWKHLGHSFIATRNIMQEVASLTKWATRSTAKQKHGKRTGQWELFCSTKSIKLQAHISQTKCCKRIKLNIRLKIKTDAQFFRGGGGWVWEYIFIFLLNKDGSDAPR